MRLKGLLTGNSIINNLENTMPELMYPLTNDVKVENKLLYK